MRNTGTTGLVRTAFLASLIIFIIGYSFAFGDVEYKIKKGDSLNKIARRFDIKARQIRSMNGLKSNKLTIGVTLIIPVGAKQKKSIAKNEESVPKKSPKRESTRTAKRIKRQEKELTKVKRALVRSEGIGDDPEETTDSVEMETTNEKKVTRTGHEPPDSSLAAQRVDGKSPAEGMQNAALTRNPDATPATRVIASPRDTDIESPVSSKMATESATAPSGTPSASGPLIAESVEVQTAPIIGHLYDQWAIKNLSRTVHLMDLDDVGKGLRLRRGESASTPDDNFEDAPAQAEEVDKEEVEGIVDNADDESPADIRLTELGKAIFDLLDIRYRYGSNNDEKMDCSAFVLNVFKKIGVTLPRSSREQFQIGEEIPASKLRKGDLVFFSRNHRVPSHVGIYLGNNKFVHISSSKKVITLTDLDQAWYRSKYIGARRVVSTTYRSKLTLRNRSASIIQE